MFPIFVQCFLSIQQSAGIFNNFFIQFNKQSFLFNRHIQQLESQTTNQTTQINSLKERLSIELNRNRQASGIQGTSGYSFLMLVKTRLDTKI